MKKTSLVLCWLCSVVLCAAQDSRLYGLLLDEAQKPIANANILLLEAQSTSPATPPQGVTSSKAGTFAIDKITPGLYFVEISHVNFTTHFFELNLASGEQKNLDTIFLQTQLYDLQEITVRGKKLSMQQSSDKISVLVEANVLGAGGTVVDILKQIPTVSVDIEGAISIRGKSDLQILIDGKPSGFAAMQGQSFLDQLDLNTIERIEVITNPSVLQSATGAGGVINIIKKKNNQNGFNARLNAGLGTDEWYHFSPGLNYRVGKVNLFGNYTFRNRKRISRQSSLREQGIGEDELNIDQWQNGIRDDQRQMVDLGLDYYIRPDQYFTLGANYRTRNKGDQKSRVQSIRDVNNTLLERRNGRIGEPERNEGWGAIAKFTAKPAETMPWSVLLDYVHSVEEEDIWREEEVLSTNDAFTEGIQTFYVDINDRILLDFEKEGMLRDSSKITYGAQFIYRNIQQNFSGNGFDDSTATYVALPELTDQFDYDDFINSLYAQVENTWGAFSFEAALRFQHLNNRYQSKSVNERFKNNYFNLFPSLKLTYEFQELSSLVLSFKRGINLPSPNRLNPFPDVSNALQVAIGNPELVPEIFYNLEGGWNRRFQKVSLTTALFYTTSRNLIERITELREDGLAYTFPINIKRMNHYGFDFNVQATPVSWWTQQLGGLLYRRSFEDERIEGMTINAFQIKTISTISISPQLELQILGSYLAPENTPQGEMAAQYFWEAGLEYEFAKQKATLALTATDLFDTLKEQSFLRNGDLYRFEEQKINTRRVYLSCKYKF